MERSEFEADHEFAPTETTSTIKKPSSCQRRLPLGRRAEHSTFTAETNKIKKPTSYTTRRIRDVKPMRTHLVSQ